jgi:hypothetical protein
MSIVLFAIIGATIKAGTAYWVCFGVYCALKIIRLIINTTIEYIQEH